MRESDRIEIAGAKVRVLVSSRQTAGRYTMCEIENAGPAAAPAHSHSYEDVCFFVLEGNFCYWPFPAAPTCCFMTWRSR
jgi:quercetin dioxygenase-like cupin family protein